ncbi:Photosynthetic NDH subunit of subcomplex B 2, chloroplastic [Varanus komodoensis]|nr:Photosynthetic NDH subunit of subcomplex B 2, chloroplastic [Varanus komodoensis]
MGLALRITLVPQPFAVEQSFSSSGAQTIGLQRHLEEQMGKKAPALVMVPAVDLPGKEVIHIACWLSQ